MCSSGNVAYRIYNCNYFANNMGDIFSDSGQFYFHFACGRLSYNHNSSHVKQFTCSGNIVAVYEQIAFLIVQTKNNSTGVLQYIIVCSIIVYLLLKCH